MASASVRAGLVVVCDTCVWIDLEHGGIRRKVFKAKLILVAPDFLSEELEWPDANVLVRLGLQLLQFPPAAMRRLGQLRRRYTKPSWADLSALVSTELKAGMLLTRDADLRAAACAEDVRVGDTLDLLEYLVTERVLSPQQAIVALDDMEAAGRELPAIRRGQLIRRLQRLAGLRP